MTILEIEHLEVHYPQKGRKQLFKAVDDVSFVVAPGATVGIVGESGSGKSTIGRAVLGLAPVSRGRIALGSTLPTARQRAAYTQVVFQDPYSSLDGQRTIGQTLSEPLEVQGVPRAERAGRVEEMLVRVGLPADAAHRYPHEFSGGQRQRIAIARALIVDPQLVICDEPISALDLSTQASVLNLLAELQEERRVAYVFIAHDLIAVRHLSDTVVVMYRGRAMEKGPAADVCGEPLHPYSKALWAAAPVPDPAEQRRLRELRESSVSGASSAAPPPPVDGCPFAPRCPEASDVCWSQRPRPVAVGERVLECHLFDEASGHPGAAPQSTADPGAQPLRETPYPS